MFRFKNRLSAITRTFYDLPMRIAVRTVCEFSTLSPRLNSLSAKVRPLCHFSFGTLSPRLNSLSSMVRPLYNLPQRVAFSETTKKTNFSTKISPQLKSKHKATKEASRSKMGRGTARNQLEYVALTNPFHGYTGSMLRDVSIICTIGPNTSPIKELYKLVDSGMNIARLNMSHGDHESHAAVIENLNHVRYNPKRKARASIAIGLAIDLKGPEIRTGMVRNDDVITVMEDDKVMLTTDEEYKEKCSAQNLYVDYAKLPTTVSVGQVIYVDDGLLSLLVTKVEPNENMVHTVAQNDATISHKKGVNIPGVSLDLPAITEQDAKDIQFAVEQEATMLFASFIRTAEDVREIRRKLGKKGKNIKIISKVENQEGLENYDAILEESDGIMVARGDLGIEIPAEKVFIAQKMMIARANIKGKPVICATQMLESMTTNPRPTRAEVSDVANAVIDGSDCVMLSGETSKGLYPRESVQMMHDICLVAQRMCNLRSVFRNVLQLQIADLSAEENIAVSACQATAEDYQIAAIMVCSISGKTAQLIAKYRPNVPIIMVTTNRLAGRYGLLYRGVYPYIWDKLYDQVEEYNDYLDEMIGGVLGRMENDEIIKRGCKVVVVQGWAAGSGSTNTMRIIDF